MATKDFKVTVDGKEQDYLVRSPTVEDQREAQKVYNQAFTDALKNKAIVRAKMDEFLEEQGLWNDEKKQNYEMLQKDLLTKEQKLSRGGIKLSDAKQLAFEMSEIRSKMRELIGSRTSLDNHSAEGQADNARFNYLASVCIRNRDNSAYFANLEDYLAKSGDDVAIVGAQTLAAMMYGLDNNFEKNLPENKFLIKYKFVDNELRFINKDGKLVDKDGRLVDENGFFVNEKGERVDKYGSLLDKNGEYLVEHQPFLDDNGNPIVEENETKEEKVVKSENDNKTEKKE